MDQLKIRPATNDDLDKLLEFEQGIIETERPFDETLREGPHVYYYDLAALIASPDAEVVVAEIGSEIVGSGYARIETSKPYHKHRRYSYLGFMYVVPEHRGKGINKKVLDVLEAWSRSKGMTEIRLEVYDQNASAIRAYEKSGYAKHTLWMRKSASEDPTAS
jgi:GNAT superfamily N-acetyltransferase